MWSWRRADWRQARANFGANLLVGLVCEVIPIDRLKKDYELGDSDAFQSFTIQDTGGTNRAIGEGLTRPSGPQSKSEELGYGGAEFVPWQIGAVM